MVRKVLPLLMALAVSLVAVGGVAAADGPIEPTPNETPQDGGGDVGVCVVGADSPCNSESPGERNTTPATHPTPVNDSDELDGDGEEDPQILLPEDQNRDGEIDERFQGDAPESDRKPDQRQTTGTHIGTGSADSDGQLWIPEDQNRNGEIDDRFVGAVLNDFSDLVRTVVTPF